MKTTDIRKMVREKYGNIAANQTSCCGQKASSCCGTSSVNELGRMIGYSDEEMKAAPDGANLGLGCGNPVALASLKKITSQPLSEVQSWQFMRDGRQPLPPVNDLN